MASVSVVSKFPSRKVIADIHELPAATHDVTRFIHQTAEQIANSLQGGGVSLNIANADPTEIAKFEKANEILSSQGKPEIEMFGEEIKPDIADINHRILDKVLSQTRNAFKKFVAGVRSEDLVEEYNSYIAPRGKSFEDCHSWENIGVTDADDSIRRRVTGLLDEVMKDNKQRLYEEVLPGFNDSPGMKDDKSKVRGVLISMLSNFVRGIYYNHQNADKVGGLRKRAVDNLNKQGKDGFFTRVVTKVKDVFRWFTS